MLSAVIVAAAFYGLKFDPAATNAPSPSRIYPVSPVAYAMVQPDGQRRLLEVADADEGVLTGPKPWLGVVRGRRIDVWADPGHTGGKLRTAFTFVDGRLRLLVLDGRKFSFPGGSPPGSLAELFPERRARTYEKGSSADIWRNCRRLRLWFANPNSAGLLCAQVALLGFCALLLGCGVWRLHGLLVAAIGLTGVAQSGSRGALLGLALGAALAIAFALRRNISARAAAMALAAAALAAGAVAMSGMADRFTDTIGQVDSGNRRRLAVVKASVRMLADAPFGWHGGEVPGRNAALNFYVADDDHVIRTHLFSVAELGWLAGGGYAFFWALALAFGLWCASRGEQPCLAEWAAFAAAGLFNPVYTELSLWALPAAASAWSGWRLRRAVTRRSLAACVLAAAGCALLGVGALAGAGAWLNAGRRTCVRAAGKATFVNGVSPRVWIVGDEAVMAGGGFPGREILAHYARRPESEGIAYVYGIEGLPAEADCVVVAGRSVPDYLSAWREGRACRAKRLLLLSPSVGPDAVPPELVGACDLAWVAGTLLAARDASYARRREWVRLVPGCERYVPNWLELSLAFANR